MQDNSTSRRKFITDSAKSVLAVSAGVMATGSLLQSCGIIGKSQSSANNTGFAQAPLGYGYNSLERAIDAQTMEIHYSKHAATYASNLKEAAAAEGVDTKKPLEDVLAKISKYSAKMRNNAGGHYNHELFWKTLSPDGGGKPEGKLLTAIEQSFNSFDSFKTQLADAGKNRFGSGWAWLYIGADKKLLIGSTPNQDNPLMNVSEIKGSPLLGLDVWEHAYYLRYQNRRADYINAWWSVVNWKFVEQRFASF
ncbi:superoxide dismutase [Terrimonas sp. NA20]|uniref:Superoxide dismutase n=1 Tax=Terrimonas ginsenosidimutans TaxID=2908004 RepID=A0ABS9KQX4_9BACT|nr:superoxide dismutase [Terrimonas ginsenosidimutans]MCG2614716.1 superoxide dismutase [Terrimonas ginsenosidimutans]